MKTINIIILNFLIFSVFSQEIKEKEIRTDINEVTVFIKGAQITRRITVDIEQGKTLLKFVNLSPFINSKSVQVKAKGEVTVLSVNHQQNFIDKLKKPQELIDLESKLQNIEEKIKVENTYLDILKEELTFLQENRDIGGKNQELNVLNLKAASDFYSTKLTFIKLKEIERRKTLADLNKEKNDIESQIKTMTSKKEYPTGEIMVKVDAKRTTTVLFEISYMVDNAGWFPSYDIRVKNINEPVELIYKANIKQDTKINWNNVKLKLSSSDPNISGVAPELKIYFLNYNSVIPNYNQTLNNVRGKVISNKNEPLPGVNVNVQGTTIGTVTDLDGNYSITIPNNATNLEFSYIGYLTEIIPINNSVLNITLTEDIMSLDEVVVIGYGTQKKISMENALQGRVSGVNIKEKEELRIRGVNSQIIPSIKVENQTTVDFEIKIPYTVKSDNNCYTVDMEVYSLPANYQYFSVPKIDKSAFLLANIIDWEKYNLLEGEANIFFEDTYIGKTLLDVRYASDTLQVSLGRDKSVSVNREKMMDYTTKQFIGSKKEETRGWRITVKNNKTQSINMIILDQVPVSTLEEIEVNLLKLSDAKHNPETGEVKWEFKLEPTNKREFEFNYSVKYPKFRNLIIE